ncbi:MAG: LysM peptidoglycan-binding domain-containing protein [Opitutales bacterium]|nr:LysM peptidoglycan-binding domain-containing protein [Opitutales bacterium]
MRSDDEDAEDVSFSEPLESGEESVVAEGASKLPLVAVGLAALALIVGLLGWTSARKATGIEEALKAEIAALRSQLAEMPDPTADLTSRLNDVDRRFETVGNELLRINQQERQLRTTREEVQRALDGITRDISRNRTALNDLGTRVETLTEGLNEVRTRRPAAVAERGTTAPTASEAAPLQDGDVTTYRIQGGDTLLVVARRFGVSLQQVLDANPGVNPNRLQIGQEIVIPPPSN